MRYIVFFLLFFPTLAWAQPVPRTAADSSAKMEDIERFFTYEQPENCQDYCRQTLLQHCKSWARTATIGLTAPFCLSDRRKHTGMRYFVGDCQSRCRREYKRLAEKNNWSEEFTSLGTSAWMRQCREECNYQYCYSQEQRKKIQEHYKTCDALYTPQNFSIGVRDTCDEFCNALGPLQQRTYKDIYEKGE